MEGYSSLPFHQFLHGPCLLRKSFTVGDKVVHNYRDWKNLFNLR